MSRIRVKKKQIEIERNIIEKFLIKIKDLIKNNRKIFLFCVLGIIAIFAIIIVGSIIYENIEGEERISYEKHIDDYNEIMQAGDTDKALGSINQFKDFIDSAQISSTRELGYYSLGNMYYTQKMYKESIEYLRKFLNEASETELTSIALLKVAVATEEMNDYNGALQIYKRLEEEYSDSVIADQIYYHIGRYYANQNDLTNAKRYFIKEISEYPKSQYAFLAKKRLFLLKISNNK